MCELTKLPNIGKVLTEKLLMAGINSIQDLKNVGAENAIIKISTIDNNEVCINMLYALEGAIQGIRWHKLCPERKIELTEFFSLLKK
jgi:DNA transformation protein and related proteins